LINLAREEKLSRANEILSKSELKQAICLEIQGCTHKDVERAMLSIINERQLTEEQKEQLELEKQAPQKFDPDIEFPIQKKLSGDFKSMRYKALSLEETQTLLAANSKPVEEKPKTQNPSYHTYSREEVERMVKEHFEYKEDERGKKAWDTTKTIESEVKIKSITKHIKSTKGSKR
jgi:hypothetical protein